MNVVMTGDGRFIEIQGTGEEATFSEAELQKLLAELQDLFPERLIVLARELTKKFEQFQRGTPAQLLEELKRKPARGEYVVLIAGASGQ